jgi:peptidoglycan/LPS O-acetylase OafA/YrhL
VIWLHLGTPGYQTLGYFRLPFFTILLAFLAAGPLLRGERRPLRAFLAIRVQRLLVPFVIWLALYRTLKFLIDGTPLVDITPNTLLLGLGNITLWYLPFAFSASLVVYALAQAIRPCPSPARRPLGAVMLALGLVATWIPIAHAENPSFWDYWLPLTGALLLGVAIPLLFPALPHAPRHWTRAILWAAVAATFAIASMLVPPALANVMGTLSGLALFLAGLAAPFNAASPVWKYLGQLSYGMYLAHYPFGRVLNRFGLESPAMSPFRFLLTVLASMALSALLLRLPWGRLLLGLSPTKRPAAPKATFQQQPIPA